MKKKKVRIAALVMSATLLMGSIGVLAAYYSDAVSVASGWGYGDLTVELGDVVATSYCATESVLYTTVTCYGRGGTKSATGSTYAHAMTDGVTLGESTHKFESMRTLLLHGTP